METGLEESTVDGKVVFWWSQVDRDGDVAAAEGKKLFEGLANYWRRGRRRRRSHRRSHFHREGRRPLEIDVEDGADDEAGAAQ